MVKDILSLEAQPRNGGEDSVRLIECVRGGKRILLVADIPGEEVYEQKAGNLFFSQRRVVGSPAPKGEEGVSQTGGEDWETGMRAEPTQETVAQWKGAFYRAYEQKQYERAEAIYRSRLPFDSEAPDVHAAYWQHRRIDKILYLFAGGLAVAALLLTWLLE